MNAYERYVQELEDKILKEGVSGLSIDERVVWALDNGLAKYLGVAVVDVKTKVVSTVKTGGPWLALGGLVIWLVERITSAR